MTAVDDSAASVDESEAGAELVTYGWRAWSDVAGLLAETEGVWLGTAGVVYCAATDWPTGLPVTTRIHAWGLGSASVLWRLIPKLTARTVLVTALVQEGILAPANPNGRRAVAVSTDHGAGWLRYRVGGPSPLMFLRPDRRDAEWPL